MNRIKIKLFLLSLFLYTNHLSAQSEATQLILQLPPSPHLNSMGAVGTAFPTTDAFGFFYNPAQLGYFSQTANFAAHFYPVEVEFLSFSDNTLSSLAISLGYNLNKVINLPISIGLGYMKANLQMPMGFISQEKYHAYSLGIGFNYIFKLGLGFTYKKAESVISYIINESIHTTATDYGMLLTFPIINYYNTLSNKTFRFTKNTFPFLDLSIGYAIKNKSDDEISYIDANFSDPLPRVANLGYALSIGYNQNYENSTIQMFAINWSVEAEDILIKSNRPGFSYQTPLSDVNVWQNIILAKGNSKVTRRWGLRIDFAEILQLGWGNLNGQGFDNEKTGGFGIHTRGLFKFLKANSKNKIINLFADHFDMKYFYTLYFLDSSIETNFNGISLMVSGF